MSDQAGPSGGPSGVGGPSGGPGPSGVGGPSGVTEWDRTLAGLLTGGGFAVHPLPWCPHLESLPRDAPEDVRVTAECEECGEAEENWLCLCCKTTHCSR